MTTSEDGRRDPRTLISLPDILSCLSAFQSEEAELSGSLAELLKAREPIIASSQRLRNLLPQLGELCADATILNQRVSNTAKTAERIGNKVGSLDEEMRRIREAGDRVTQVMDLKSSLSTLQAAIECQDWELATRHCARTMALPPEVIAGRFAETVVPTPEIHLPPTQTLQVAREKLLDVFRKFFDAASRARDSNGTSRFFKLFPTIGCEAEGLDAYAKFVVELVRVKAPPSVKTSSPLYYITALTTLFEGIAMVVDQHQPVVEKYYGPGQMRRVVVRLLEECDQVTITLIHGWEEDRSMQRKLMEVVNNPPHSTFSSSPPKKQSSGDDAAIDPREIDKVLSEVAAMIGRWHLFKRFLWDTPKASEDTRTAERSNGNDKSLEPDITSNTTSEKLFREMTGKYYIPMEVWYTRTIISKAHKMATPDLLQSPIISTAPDDVFYIFKSVITRMLTTGSLYVVDQTLPQLREIFDSDYIGVIKQKMEDVYRNAGPVTSVARPDRVEKENRAAFMIQLNDLDVSTSHLERISHHLAESPLISHFCEVEQPVIKDRLSLLSSLTLRVKSSLRVSTSGIEQLFNQLLRPKLRNFVFDMYKDVLYVMDEDAYASADYHDTVRKRFVKAWETLLEGYKHAFSENNYRLFIGLILDVLLKPWEKYVVGLKYSELGAVRFDRDLRAIIAYLTSQTSFGDVRDKFLRMQQISSLLNLDPEEDVDEFYNGSGISWKVGPHEARSIAALKM